MVALVLLALAVVQTADSTIDRIVRDGIEGGVFPGAVVVVGTERHLLYAAGHGHFTWSPTTVAPDPGTTLYDLASLTKVVAATPAVMLLVERGAVDLDRAVQGYLPGFRGAGKERVTVRHLLEHRSGLRAFLPLHERTVSAAEAREAVLTEPLRYMPGTRVVYSDLNGMLLGWLVEEVSGMTLGAFVRTELYELAGMHDTGFRPPRVWRGRTAPVGLWRGHAIAGELHDQNAVRLGGVSGHAGLYTTGLDLARYAQLLLRGGTLPDGATVFRAATVEHFTRRGAGNRALGWEVRDTASTENHGALLSASAFGHTGFTGTSLWIDPERGLFVVVLTNRVFAPRARHSVTRLKRIRGDIADAAVRLHERWCVTEGPALAVTCR